MRNRCLTELPAFTPRLVRLVVCAIVVSCAVHGASAPAQGPPSDEVLRLPPVDDAGSPSAVTWEIPLEQPPSPPGMLPDGLPDGDEPAAAGAEGGGTDSESAESNARAVDDGPAADGEPPDEIDGVAIPTEAIEQTYWQQIVMPYYEEAKRWEGSFELGMDGTEGNSRTLNYRLGLDLERKNDVFGIKFDLDYNRKTSQSIETTNQAFFTGRIERYFGKTRFSWFLRNTLEHDRYESYNLRVSADTGMGFKVIDSESTELVARLGGGSSREFGLPEGVEEFWVPEMSIGMELEHKIGKRHKFKLSVEHVPDVSDFTEYRINSRGSWEMLVDEEMNLSLKLSAVDRYDSTPNGAKYNDIDYSAVLLWKF